MDTIDRIVMKCPKCSEHSLVRPGRFWTCKNCGNVDAGIKNQADYLALPADPIVAAVMRLLAERSAAGMREHGAMLTRPDVDLAGWLRHLQQELLDGANYIEAALRKIEGGAE